jgi:hypothetical protein
MSASTRAISPLEGAIYSAFMQQAIILILAAMILDGGCIGQVCIYAFLGFWGGVFVLRVRTRDVLTKVDLLLIRGGYILVCILSFFITRSIWTLRGFGGYL